MGPNLRPDGKTQVSVRYVNGAPTQVEKVVVSTQHSEETDPTELRKALKRNVGSVSTYLIRNLRCRA